MSDRRHTQHEESWVAGTAQEIAEVEARNGLLQYDLAVRVIMDAIDRKSFRLRPSLLLSLHRVALQGISSSAGSWRAGPVSISGSEHQPIAAAFVPEEVEHLCDYINDRWESSSALHLASFAMWRLNWIHPFTDGNGRTSRMISYVVLSAKAQSVLPGSPQIPDQIASDRGPYFEALEAADQAWRAKTGVDVSKMEDLLAKLLARQLLDAHSRARG